MSLILKTTVRLRGKTLARQLDAAAETPAAAQQAFLRRILNQNAATAFGREHQFSHLQREQDYRNAVPIADYEAFRPYINRLLAGEKAVLTAASPFMFALTSGTTSKPKYIPVTRQSEELGSRIMRQWLYRALLDHPRYLDCATVGIVSPAIEGKTAMGIPYGSVSGRIYQQIPAIVRRSYAVPYPVFELENYDERYWAIARFALARQISFLSTANPSTLSRLAEIVAAQPEAFIRAIHDGTLGLPGTPARPFSLQPFLKPQPQRARELTRIVNRTHTLYPKDYWPQLQLIGCWTGGSVGSQIQKLQRYFGSLPIRDLGYLASEARMTLPYQDHTAAGILALNTNYYEFVPEAAADAADPPLFSSHELEAGRRYSIVLTTAAGLYRYRINDIVEVAGFYKNAPLLTFVRKGQDMTNLTGEKMHVNHVLQAVEQVQQQFQLAIVQYRMIANATANRYDFYLELQQSPPRTQIQQQLLTALDRALAAVNLEYKQKRQSKRLQPLRLHLMHPGWSEAAVRKAIHNGQRDAQYKWKVLCQQVKAVDQQSVAIALEGADEAG